MASSGQKWDHDEWNSVIQQVNNILQNPPEGTDCDPIDELEEVDECHKWSVDDITEVHDALKATCDTIAFPAVEACDKWEVKIIDDIEAAYPDAWCDCEDDDEQCLVGCSNGRPPGSTIEEIFLGGKTVADTDCTEVCSGGCGESGPGDFCGPFTDNDTCIDVRDAWFDWNDAIDDMEMFGAELCGLCDQLDELNDQLDTLEEQVTSICGANPGSPECLAKTAERDAKEAERDAKQTEKNDKQAEYDGAKSDAEAAVAANRAALDSAKPTGAHESTWQEWASGESEPWDDFDPDDPCGIEDRAVCDTTSIDKCRGVWFLQQRSICLDAMHTNANVLCNACVCFVIPNPGNWNLHLSGTYHWDGQTIGRCRVDALCPVKPLFKVLSLSGGCPGGCVSINGFSCNATTQYRLRKFYPTKSPNFCCDSGTEDCTPGNPESCPPCCEEGQEVGENGCVECAPPG